jgi:hypothetical protein
MHGFDVTFLQTPHKNNNDIRKKSKLYTYILLIYILKNSCRTPLHLMEEARCNSGRNMIRRKEDRRNDCKLGSMEETKK